MLKYDPGGGKLAFSNTAYKYVNLEGAKKIIANSSLRFARPAEMNDPFDVRIDELFDSDLEQFLGENKLPLFDLFVQNPEPYLKRKGFQPKAAEMFAKALGALPEADKVQLRNEFAATDLAKLYPDMDGMKQRIEADRQFVISNIENTGIFCATKNFSNLLMWAHYADQHKGLVLGFKPSLERDSMLMLLEPVIYSNERPAFYDPKLDWNPDADKEASRIVSEQIIKRIHFTKSLHWSYEEELRFVIPDEVKQGEQASFLKFYPEELAELYLGCRMEENVKDQISSIALKLNPKVAIFQSKLAKYSYELEFIKIV